MGKASGANDGSAFGSLKKEDAAPGVSTKDGEAIEPCSTDVAAAVGESNNDTAAVGMVMKVEGAAVGTPATDDWITVWKTSFDVTAAVGLSTADDSIG